MPESWRSQQREYGRVLLEAYVGRQKMPSYSIREAGSEEAVAADKITRIGGWSGLSLDEMQQIVDGAPDFFEGTSERTDKRHYQAALRRIGEQGRR